jgi:hypothetical protein
MRGKKLTLRDSLQPCQDSNVVSSACRYNNLVNYFIVCHSIGVASVWSVCFLSGLPLLNLRSFRLATIFENMLVNKTILTPGCYARGLYYSVLGWAFFYVFFFYRHPPSAHSGDKVWWLRKRSSKLSWREGRKRWRVRDDIKKYLDLPKACPLLPSAVK